jgi:hypothetical protein
MLERSWLGWVGEPGSWVARKIMYIIIIGVQRAVKRHTPTGPIHGAQKS